MIESIDTTNNHTEYRDPAREVGVGSSFYKGDVVTVVDAAGISHIFREPYGVDDYLEQDGSYTLVITTLEEPFPFKGFQSVAIGSVNHPTIITESGQK